VPEGKKTREKKREKKKKREKHVSLFIVGKSEQYRQKSLKKKERAREKGKTKERKRRESLFQIRQVTAEERACHRPPALSLSVSVHVYQ
jgi:hypothetical protein